MATDWSVVNASHVQQACALHDAGTAVPRNPARNTVLLMNGKRYPAKFIRGLAYKLATGTSPEPYTGGLATTGFFTRLGLTTEHDGKAILPHTRVVAKMTTPTMPTVAVARREITQKSALLALLTSRFGTVIKEATFEWLSVPAQQAMTGVIASLHAALRSHRGHADFANPGFCPRCDFYVPSHRLLVEYDQRQHFTLPRAVTLGFYPAELKSHFDRTAWVADCQRIKANDPTPIDRDETRAFYDALRDILAAENGYTLIRLRDGAFDWTRPEAGAELDAVLTRWGVSPAALHTHPTNGGRDRITRLAVVSHDYRRRDSTGRWDYSEHFVRINRLCDEAGCDTILYALYTWDARSQLSRTQATMFDGTHRLKRVVIEVGDFGANGGNLGLADLSIEVWERHSEIPRVIRQRFATSKAGWADGGNLVSDFPKRRIADDGLVMVCGETNAVSLVRATKKMYDPRGINEQFARLGTQVVLNPIHDYMRRYEMKEKRRYFSSAGRWVVSVWNQGKGKESAKPWTVFHDGKEMTDIVQELPKPIAERPDIRIGIIDI